MQKVKDNYVAELIVVGAITIALLSSCEIGESAKAMPPVHQLYEQFTEEEKGVYNILNAEQREVVNRNTEMHQLRQALDTNMYYGW